MKHLVFLFPALIVSLSLFACSDGHNNDAYLIEVSAFVDRICACEDMACSKAPADSLEKLGWPKEMSSDEKEKATELDAKAASCLLSFVTTGIVKDYDLLSQHVCACKDYECAETTIEGIQKLKNAPPPSAGDVEKINRFIKKMYQCQKALLTDDVVRAQMADAELLKGLVGWSDKVCACNDSACAKKALQAFRALEWEKKPGKKAQQTIRELKNKATICIANVTD